MKIISVVPESLVEWPGHLSYVIFLAGCNLKCKYCYVPHLALPERYEKMPEIPKEKVIEDIKKRASSSKKWLDAVCITGGEPTIHEQELYDFLQKIKQESNIKIRLETNGTNPDLLERLLRQKLIDSIALDIKNSKQGYKEISDVRGAAELVAETISLVKSLGLRGFDYEFRTTLVPGIHTAKDLEEIADWIYAASPVGTAKKMTYFLQQFRTDLPNQETVAPEFMKRGNYPLKEMEKIKQKLEALGYFEKVEIRAK